MKDLQEARKLINETDKKMAELFAQRMETVKKIAEFKKEMGLPVTDSAREEQMINNNSNYIEDEVLKSYYVNFLRYNMLLSRRYQHRLMEGMRVAYSGVEGAFADIASKRIFPDACTVSYKDFKSAYEAVENGECDCAVLPLENSYAGDVSQVMDLSFFGSLYINGIYDMEIVQNLLGVKGACINDIKEVVSHPQGLWQCADYIREHEFITHEAANTARAAKQVFEGNDKTIAAIGSAEAADIYGLDVLDKNINDGNINKTRFAVFSRFANKNENTDNYFVMTFTVRNEAGSLGKVLSVIGDAGFNLRSLKSRPTKDSIWEYYFFAEGEGNVNSLEGKKMLHDLKRSCNNIKIVGSFEKKNAALY